MYTIRMLYIIISKIDENNTVQFGYSYEILLERKQFDNISGWFINSMFMENHNFVQGYIISFLLNNTRVVPEVRRLLP